MRWRRLRRRRWQGRWHKPAPVLVLCPSVDVGRPAVAMVGELCMGTTTAVISHELRHG